MPKDEFTQCKLGDAFISEIVTNSKSRDHIPALLIGLQRQYMCEQLIYQVLHCTMSRSIATGARMSDGRVSRIEKSVLWFGFSNIQIQANVTMVLFLEF